MDPNTLGLIILGVINLANALLTILAHRDVRKIEIATNSMKDALIVATAKASKSEGREEMRLELDKK